MEITGKARIVRFEQYKSYPDSARSIGTIIEINTDDPKKEKEWTERYISFFEGYPHLFIRLEDKFLDIVKVKQIKIMKQH